MAKIKLNPDPTFSYPVTIPVPGGEAASIVFTFKHRTRDEIIPWLENLKGKTDAACVTDMATAWDLDEEFSPENVERLCQNYGGAGTAILDTYLSELRGARVKN